MRKIIHVDADAFFAAVEQRDRPELRGKPVAVAHPGPRSVVAGASYEARRFGVGSAMPLAAALRRCPDLIVTEPRMDAYREASRVMHATFAEFTDLIEPLSLDEAYLDVTVPLTGPRSATLIAREVRRLIPQRTGGLTVSAGVSYNKLLAKLGSGLHKPDGLSVILPGQAQALLDRLPVSVLHGVGPKTTDRLERMGVRTGADLRATPLATLRAAFGQRGADLHAMARGEDARPVTPPGAPQSIGAEDTFPADLTDLADLRAHLRTLSDRAAARLRARQLGGATVCLKLKFSDFSVITHQTRLAAPTDDPGLLWQASAALLASAAGGRAVRLIGLSVRQLGPLRAPMRPLLEP